MNKQRRKQLEEVSELIENAKCILEELRDEETEYRDNIPENLQGSEKYEKADCACDSLDNAVDNLDEAINNINEAVE